MSVTAVPAPGLSVQAAGRAAERLLENIAGGLLALDVALIFVSVLCRYLLGAPLAWSEEAARLCLICFTFIGMALAFRRRQHLAVTLLVTPLPDRARLAVGIAAQYAILVFAVAVAWSSLPLITRRWTMATPALGLSQAWFLLPMLFGLLLMAFYAALNLLRSPRELTAGVGVAAAAASLLLAWQLDAWLPFVQGLNPLIPILAVYLLALAAGVPLGIDLGLAALSYVALQGQTPLSIVPARMAEGVNQFVLLAVPFFILAGAVMEAGGISARLVGLVDALVGHLRGGLGLVTVISMVLFSGISGSKAADISAVGGVMAPAMRRHGHGPGESVAILTASAAMGETIPPSIAMLVLGSVSSLSVTALFVAGLMPALATAGSLLVLIAVKARFGTLPRPKRASVQEVGTALRRASLALTMPVMVLGALLLGVATPTEVSALAAVYALAIAGLVYRAVPPARIRDSLVASACTTGVILFMISTATVLAWILSLEGLPQSVASWMVSVSHTPYLFFALTIVLVVTLSTLLEGLPALIILAPLLLPVVTKLHIAPVHFGIVLIVAMGVGAAAPAVGILLTVGCAVCGTSIEQTLRPYLPYFLVLLLSLVVIAYVPWLTLALPRSLGLIN